MIGIGERNPFDLRLVLLSGGGGGWCCCNDVSVGQRRWRTDDDGWLCVAVALGRGVTWRKEEEKEVGVRTWLVDAENRQITGDWEEGIQLGVENQRKEGSLVTYKGHERFVLSIRALIRPDLWTTNFAGICKRTTLHQ